MNKAFVREPDVDGSVYCPRCGAAGVAVGAAAMDRHIRADVRSRMGERASFCGTPSCDVAYFNWFGACVTIDELNGPVYPKDPDAPLCACFGFTLGEIEADVRDGTPSRIRALLAQSQSPAARCASLAADGRCCMPEVQRRYMRLRE